MNTRMISTKDIWSLIMLCAVFVSQAEVQQQYEGLCGVFRTKPSKEAMAHVLWLFPTWTWACLRVTERGRHKSVRLIETILLPTACCQQHSVNNATWWCSPNSLKQSGGILRTQKLRSPRLIVQGYQRLSLCLRWSLCTSARVYVPLLESM